MPTNAAEEKPISLIACGEGPSVLGPDIQGNCYLQSDSNGQVDFTNLYYDQCDNDDSLVYLVAFGGQINGVTNSVATNLAVMPVGCAALQSAPGMYVSELTSVAAAFTTAPFDNFPVGTYIAYPNSFADGISYKDKNGTGAIQTAFQAANALVSSYDGSYTTTDSNVQATINTLADVLDQCIYTDGDTSSGSTCGNLFSNVWYYFSDEPADTYQAILSIAQAPFYDTDTLYQGVSTSSPWQPILASVPGTWALPIANAPQINSVDPSNLNLPDPYAVGTTQIISGTNLMIGSTIPLVAVNGVQATVTNAKNTSISFVVPSNVTQQGFVGVYVGNAASNFSGYAP